jgi:glycosyltransferase involved in cell wall biosynthesis
MSDNRIIMLLKLPNKPITGGEIYMSKLYNYLQRSFSSVDNISWEPKHHRSKLQFLVNSIIQNLSFLKILKEINGKTVIIEDISDCESLFIFNLLTRYFRRILSKDVFLMPIVTHTYAPLIDNGIKRQLRSFQEWIFINSSDAIIVISEFTKATVESILLGHKDIIVAYPGLNISYQNDNSLQEPDLNTVSYHSNTGVEKDSLNVHLLFVGYITPRKGIDILIKSLEILIKNYGFNNIILHIAGDLERDPVFSRKIRDYCYSAGLEKNVRIYGRVSENKLYELYTLSDIFVFPSLWEGFGMVLIEAMHYRLPIVTTDAGAIPYLVKNGINGFLVPAGDAKQLAQATRKLIESSDLRRQIGENNYRLASKFTWDESFTKIKPFLDDIFENIN